MATTTAEDLADDDHTQEAEATLAVDAAAAAVPIPGGGYCFCDRGCDNSFTDNNSHGGCCADYEWRCEGGQRDQLCMDARTQAQALQLFVAHHVLRAT